MIFGDATSESVLSHAGITHARIAVVAINDPVATRKITDLCRRVNPQLSIIVRTRYVSEVEALQALGADEVVAEEFETSVEIFTVVLSKFFVPRDRIERFITDVRADGYQMLRSRDMAKGTLPDLVRHIPNMTIATFTVEPGSFLAGKTLLGVNLRKQYHLLVLAIRRGEEMLTALSGESRLEAGDVAIVYGSPEDITKGTDLFEGPYTR